MSTFVATSALIAALPDLDLLYPTWHRGPSHSVTASVFLMIIAAAVTRWVTGQIAWRWVVMVGAAHASHTLFDWMGTDRYFPRGLQALWPFSDRWYISGWDVFPPTERRIYLPEAIPINLRAIVAEVAITSPLVALAWLAKRRRRTRGLTSVPDIPPSPSA